jgi:hypothetical protein
MDTIIKWISNLAPFLSPYPLWIKIVFASWVGLSAVLIASLVLARPLDKTDTKQPILPQPIANQMQGKSDVTHSARDQQEVWLIIDWLGVLCSG